MGGGGGRCGSCGRAGLGREALLLAAPRSPYLRRHTPRATLIHTVACRLGEVHLQLQVTKSRGSKVVPVCVHAHWCTPVHGCFSRAGACI